MRGRDIGPGRRTCDLSHAEHAWFPTVEPDAVNVEFGRKLAVPRFFSFSKNRFSRISRGRFRAHVLYGQCLKASRGIEIALCISDLQFDEQLALIRVKRLLL